MQGARLVRLDYRKIIMGKGRPIFGCGKFHVAPAQEDLLLQIKLKELCCPALTWLAATLPDPFPEKKLPSIPIGCSYFYLSIAGSERAKSIPRLIHAFN